jgi:uncharacterized glyoxalase superfamily protein PhnB
MDRRRRLRATATSFQHQFACARYRDLCPFYREVLGAFVHYSDVDFGALKVGGAEVQLHADHAYDAHPWYPRLTGGEARGLGAEFRLLGLDPDSTEERAHRSGAKVVKPVTERGHGWREVMVEDPDGYVWAVGVLTERETTS